MENKELSKAERYNNPGAIRPYKVIYEGQVDVDADGFAIFETPEAGRRALIKQIDTQIKRGENTVDAFLNRYAPPGKENPQASRDNYRVFLAEQLGLKSTSDPFPKGSTERIADAVTKFESGSAWGKPPAAPSESNAEETSSGQLTDQQRRDKLVEEVKELPGKVAQEYPTATRAAIDVAGASLGAQAGRFAETGRERAAQAAADLLRSSAQPATPAVQPAATPPAPIPTDPMHTRQMQGTTDAGATGRARQQTYNVGTSQQAAAANEQAKVIEQLKRQGLVSGDAKSLLAKAPGLTSTPSGVLLPSSQVYADIPPTQGTAPTPPAPAQPPQRPSALSRVTGGMSRGMQIAPRAFPGLTGMLGGLGAAELGQEAFRRGSEGDVIGSMIAGGGALGSAASLLPFPQTRVGGPAVAMVSPLALYLYDKAKDRAVSQAKGFGALASGAQLPAPSIYSGFTGP